jgi:hypothetical protein
VTISIDGEESLKRRERRRIYFVLCLARNAKGFELAKWWVDAAIAIIDRGE